MQEQQVCRLSVDDFVMMIEALARRIALERGVEFNQAVLDEAHATVEAILDDIYRKN